MPLRPLTLRWYYVVDGLCVLAAAASFYMRPSNVSSALSPSEVADSILPSSPISLDQAPTLGSRNATVAVVMFADFECPFCARFERDTLPALRRDYIGPGHVLFAFRLAPLKIHPMAEATARAAVCAREQGKFWELTVPLFGHQGESDSGRLQLAARDAGLAESQFADCLKAPSKALDNEVALGHQLAVYGTPTFFVGRLIGGDHVRVTGRFEGVRSEAYFRSVIDEVLAGR